jgi:putative transposase
MPPRPRIATGGLAYHLLNRRLGRLPLFEPPKDYALFETILREAVEQKQMRLISYCLMGTSNNFNY